MTSDRLSNYYGFVQLGPITWINPYEVISVEWIPGDKCPSVLLKNTCRVYIVNDNYPEVVDLIDGGREVAKLTRLIFRGIYPDTQDFSGVNE